MDAFVPRVQPEPVVADPRGAVRQQRRRRREGQTDDGQEPQFPLENGHTQTHAVHAEPRSPNEDGLGRNLDVTA